MRIPACIVLIVSIASGISAQRELELILDPGIIYQTMHSFGASDAWSTQYLGKYYPLEKREQMAEWLFSREFDKKGNPKGIGLSLWRFNIGTGGAQLGDRSRMAWDWRRTDCFRDSAGNWDWSRHEGQRWFLEKAREYGVEYTKAIVYSPPYWWTHNGLNISSPEDPVHMNIRAGKTDDYAAFIAAILEHFQKAGIPFDYLSPLNEPEWDWSTALAEGTPATNDELYMLVRYLDREFTRRDLGTKMLIGDCGDVRFMYRNYKNDEARGYKVRAFCDPSSPTYLGEFRHVEKAISCHSYHSVWPVDTLIDTRMKLAECLRKTNEDFKYWQTEYCILQENNDIGGGWGRDLGMNTALYIARIIHHDLTLANAVSWQFWTAMSQVDFKGGLIYVDAGEGNPGSRGPRDPYYESLKYDGYIRDSKILWALGNYSRFIRPGMVRIRAGFNNRLSLAEQANDLMVSAYRQPGGKRLVIVLVNYSREGKWILLPEIKNSKPIGMYITSKEMNLEYTEPGGKDVEIPARSVATVLME